MKTKPFFSTLALFATLLSANTLAATAMPKADNTKINERDRESYEVTADQQREARTDVSITQNIRRALMKDKALSAYAKNIKVITIDGEVTLKGPVKSKVEETKIIDVATQMVGAGKINNQIEIAAQ